jgi:DNA repair photolyase
MDKANVSGTKEWAVKNVNCCEGCSHDCRYCYARHFAVDRFHRRTESEWSKMRIREKEVNRRHRKYPGRVMFPTSHDVTPEVLDVCLAVLGNLLDSGNQVLIVTKPHLECVKAVCARCEGYKSQILFRFTITADDDALLKYWEPGAPRFEERMASLRLAFERGFTTSISIEPMLDAPNIIRLVEKMTPWATHSVWIGKMNQVETRIKVRTVEDHQAVAGIKKGQTNERIREIYGALQGNPKIRWKESIKKVVGLELAAVSGLDR